MTDWSPGQPLPAGLTPIGDAVKQPENSGKKEFTDEELIALGLTPIKSNPLPSPKLHGRAERDIRNYPTISALKDFKAGDIGARQSYLLGRKEESSPEEYLEQFRTFYPEARYIEGQGIGDRIIGYTDPETGEKRIVGTTNDEGIELPQQVGERSGDTLNRILTGEKARAAPSFVSNPIDYLTGLFSHAPGIKNRYIGINPGAYELGDVASTAFPLAGGVLGAAIPAVVGGAATAASVPATAGAATGPLAALTTEGATIGGALGATAGSNLEEGIANLLGAYDPRSPYERATDTVYDLGINLAAPGAVSAIGKGITNIARPVFGKPIENAAQFVRDYVSQFGERPFASQVVRGGVTPTMEGVLSKISTSAHLYKDKAKNLASGAQKNIGSFVEGVGGNISKQQAGENILSSAKQTSEAGRKQYEEAMEAILQRSKPSSDVSIDNTVRSILGVSENRIPEIHAVLGDRTKPLYDKFNKFINRQIDEKSSKILESVDDSSLGLENLTPRQAISLKNKIKFDLGKQIKDGIVSGEKEVEVNIPGTDIFHTVDTAIKSPDGKSLGVSGYENKTPAQVLHILKKRIGENYNKPNISPETKANLDLIYNSVKDDAREAISPDARALYDPLLKIGSKYKKEVQPYQKELLESRLHGEDVPPLPTEAVDTVLKGIEQGDDQLKRMFRAIPDKKIQDQVAGYKLDQLGYQEKQAGDKVYRVFDPEKFISDWASISPEAKKTLFGGPEFKNYDKNLDKVVDLIDTLKSSPIAPKAAHEGRRLSQVGGVEGVSAIGSYALFQSLGLLGGAPAVGAAVGIAAVPRLTGKLFTNPKFIDWLAKVPQHESQGTFPGWLRQLKRSGIYGVEGNELYNSIAESYPQLLSKQKTKP